MKGLRWFQTKVGVFQDPRMMYLLNQPHGDSYFVIWFYIKDLAGMINDDGYIYVSERQAMPTELLARQLRCRKAFVERVLDVFEQIDLISRDETGLMRIVPWDEIQSFSRDEKKRSDARDRMRRYRQRQREGQAKAAAGASHNEMAGCMPDERIRSVNGQACKTGYTAPCGKIELECVQHDEQVGAMLDEKMQSINELIPETEPAASYGGTVVDYPRNGMKAVDVPDKKRLRVNGQTHQTEYAAPSGKAEWECVHYGEQVGVLLDAKVQGVDKPIPEREYAASYGEAVMGCPRNSEKDAAGPDEKVQSANGQTHKVKCAVANDGVILTCTQLSERQELAAYERDDIDGIQGEEGAEGIAYVTEDRAYAPGAGSAADRFDEGRDTCGDREEPSFLPGGKALLYYEALFGKADGQTVEALQGLARRWGEEAVCRAICIALKKGASSVQYIHAVLVHSKGSPRHDTAPSPYETERSMPSGRGGLRHISDMSWGSPDVSLGEGICPVYDALP
ncbi:phage replisome organizer N-terminal domain-containing protein [Megasphaera butyrica]|uniref:phage replisome organizer N-terminal domain-containing protein n=1 Tax=Megasphaera butyrica TaxID=2981791 RepID=UPI00082128A2|nr:phage replisome organizer N-terminal domain-containing protein [Megasphaera butyrica]MCU6714998.1 phage replisome organizer N-terminal domain-containing protein [Megasphaera butyrica]SCH87679.1 phage replisome organizer%2C putative%2C N-terminal region [uncultured Megasphaera sp.]SCJ47323.1 phage replisome organizer%2C putative%2C N-terminal region [uncultured Ruminococcus sp.]